MNSLAGGTPVMFALAIGVWTSLATCAQDAIEADDRTAVPALEELLASAHAERQAESGWLLRDAAFVLHGQASRDHLLAKIDAELARASTERNEASELLRQADSGRFELQADRLEAVIALAEVTLPLRIAELHAAHALLLRETNAADLARDELAARHLPAGWASAKGSMLLGAAALGRAQFDEARKQFTIAREQIARIEPPRLRAQLERDLALFRVSLAGREKGLDVARAVWQSAEAGGTLGFTEDSPVHDRLLSAQVLTWLSAEGDFLLDLLRSYGVEQQGERQVVYEAIHAAVQAGVAVPLRYQLLAEPRSLVGKAARTGRKLDDEQVGVQFDQARSAMRRFERADDRVSSADAGFVAVQLLAGHPNRSLRSQVISQDMRSSYIFSVLDVIERFPDDPRAESAGQFAGDICLFGVSHVTSAMSQARHGDDRAFILNDASFLEDSLTQLVSSPLELEDRRTSYHAGRIVITLLQAEDLDDLEPIERAIGYAAEAHDDIGELMFDDIVVAVGDRLIYALDRCETAQATDPIAELLHRALLEYEQAAGDERTPTMIARYRPVLNIARGEPIGERPTLDASATPQDDAFDAWLRYHEALAAHDADAMANALGELDADRAAFILARASAHEAARLGGALPERLFWHEAQAAPARSIAIFEAHHLLLPSRVTAHRLAQALLASEPAQSAAMLDTDDHRDVRASHVRLEGWFLAGEHERAFALARTLSSASEPGSPRQLHAWTRMLQILDAQNTDNSRDADLRRALTRLGPTIDPQRTDSGAPAVPILRELAERYDADLGFD